MFCLWVITLLGLVVQVAAVRAEATTRTDVVHATYRLSGGKSNATCCVVGDGQSAPAGQQRLWLVTAAHVLETIDGNEAVLVARSTNEKGEFIRSPHTIVIRRDSKPLWFRHPEQDVAVLGLETSEDLRSVPLEALATAADWDEISPEPGDLVRCVGFPHAAHFDPSPAAFPLVRLGCVASYPLRPLAKQPTFLVDFNTFEGDSGGPVLMDTSRTGDRAVKMIGLASAQHFIDEKYDLIYEKGHIRKRLGLSIAIHSQSILETIRLAEADPTKPQD